MEKRLFPILKGVIYLGKFYRPNDWATAFSRKLIDDSPFEYDEEGIAREVSEVMTQKHGPELRLFSKRSPDGPFF